MSKAAFIKRQGALWPMDDDGREIVAALADDKQVMVAVHVPRNIKHHRLFWAVHKKLVEGGVIDWNEAQFKDWAKSAAGHIEPWYDHEGRVQYRPKSMNFESLDQVKFSRFFDRVIYQIFARLLGSDCGMGHNSWQAFRDEIIEMVDGDLGRRAKEGR